MGPRKIKKSKEVLENILKQTRDKFIAKLEKDFKSLEQNVNVEAIQYQKRIQKIKADVLQKLNISDGEYSRAEIIAIMDGELSGIEDRILKALKEVETNWKDIKKRPDFKGLKTQTDKLSQTLTQVIAKVKAEIASRAKIEKVLAELAKTIPQDHDDLSGITPNNHHLEEHILESHTRSELLEKLYRLVSGKKVDDLHKHKEKKGRGFGRNFGLWNPAHFHDDVYYRKTEVVQLIAESSGEIPTGTVNGANTVFTLAHTPDPAASLQVFVNGAFLTGGGEDYTLVDDTITFVTAPPTNSIIRAFYKYTV